MRSPLDVFSRLTQCSVAALRRPRSPSRTVAIVVPLSSRLELLPDEELSMRHLCRFLGGYDKYLVVPSGTSIEREGFRIVRCPRKFFGSAAAHNRLLMWRRFYQTFVNYEYILIHHLDSLVLSDGLSGWCQTGVDYIGAPWLPCGDTPWVKEPQVGNGGFTLMKVDSVLKVLRNRHRTRPRTFWTDLVRRNETVVRPLVRLLEALPGASTHSTVLTRLLDEWHQTQNPALYGRNNDFFWSFDAVRYLSTFKVATVEQGLRFAFEAAPRLCFELNLRRLPFGCHAWTKFDRSFWEPHLLPATDAASTTRGTQTAVKKTITSNIG
jgi:hypothetical protein